MTLDAEGTGASTEPETDTVLSDSESELSATAERWRFHAAAVNEFCEGFDAVQLGVAALIESGQAETALALLRLLEQDLQAWLIPDTVAAAREQGASWADVGEALGVSRQGARQRYRQSDRVEG